MSLKRYALQWGDWGTNKNRWNFPNFSEEATEFLHFTHHFWTTPSECLFNNPGSIAKHYYRCTFKFANKICVQMRYKWTSCTCTYVHVHHKMLLVKMTKLKIYLSITHVNQRGIVGRLKQLEVEQFSIKELPRQAHVPGDRSPTHIIGKHCSLHPRHKQRGQVDTTG